METVWKHKKEESTSGYSHDGLYEIKGMCRMKDYTTGKWYDAIQYFKYRCVSPTYVREKNDFYKNMEPIGIKENEYVSNDIVTVSCKEMESKKNAKYRMYSIVLGALSPMQKGIQSTHSIIEYINEYGYTDECNQWMESDKTIIILNASNGSSDLVKAREFLYKKNINFESFSEESLNELETSVSFIVDENNMDEEVKEYLSNFHLAK